MKKFIYSLSLFSLFLISLYILVAYLVKPENTANNDYMAAIIDKHERLHQINGPKIFFAGGSNLAFGLDSEKIENQFNVPVVNLGIHAGLGMDFILNELKSNIKKDDIVVLSIEYFLSKDGDYKLKKNTSDSYSEARKYYSTDFRSELVLHFDTTRENITSLMTNKNQASVTTENEVYSRKAFNKYGDLIAHLDKKQPEKLRTVKALNYRNWEGITELNEFYEFAKSKQVAVFFMFPNYAQSEFKRNEMAITKLTNDIKNNLIISIINEPADFVFPDSLFYDTVYHLNKKGREIRTNQLVDIMLHNKAFLKRIQVIKTSK